MSPTGCYLKQNFKKRIIKGYLAAIAALLVGTDFKETDNRSPNGIIIPNTSLTLAKRSFCYRGAEDWSKLQPENIRRCEKLGQFKTKLRTWIHENVPPFGDG